MVDLTPDRLQELRRIAEAATPGPLTVHLCDDARYAAFVDAPHLGPDAPELAVFLIERDARFFAEFDRDTVLALLDEIERLRRVEWWARRICQAHQDVEQIGYAQLRRAINRLSEAINDVDNTLALLDGEKGGGGE